MVDGSIGRNKSAGGSAYFRFEPDGKFIASTSGDRTVKLWAATSGERMQTLEGHTGRVNSTAFFPNSKVLASASENKIKLWSMLAKAMQSVGFTRDPRGHRRPRAASGQPTLLLRQS